MYAHDHGEIFPRGGRQIGSKPTGRRPTFGIGGASVHFSIRMPA